MRFCHGVYRTSARRDPCPLPSITAQADHGVALEYQIQHANLSDANPWFTIPHLADDDYIRNAAELIRDTLEPGRVARIEYSNEVWNNLFAQAGHAREQGTAAFDSGNVFRDQLYWYSQRSVEMFDIFEDVFTEGGTRPEGMDRLVRVMSAQAANPWTGARVLKFEDAYANIDALAIAPYFGRLVRAGDEAEAWKNADWEGRLAMTEERLTVAKNNMTRYADLLNTIDDNGDTPYADIELFAYEGGQHFLGHPNTHNDPELTELFFELNRRPEMEAFYLNYLRHWAEIGGSDFMLFSSLSGFSRSGSWGLMEYEGQPLADTPKLRAALRFIEETRVIPEPGAATLATALGGTLLLRRRTRARMNA